MAPGLVSFYYILMKVPMEKGQIVQDVDTTGDSRDVGDQDNEGSENLGEKERVTAKKKIPRTKMAVNLRAKEKTGDAIDRKGSNPDAPDSQLYLLGDCQDHYVSAHSRLKSEEKMLIRCVLSGTVEVDTPSCNFRIPT